ncbi:MAG: hypothetical protein ABJ004_10335 [Cyclobacteriaceae bacterium]
MRTAFCFAILLGFLLFDACGPCPGGGSGHTFRECYASDSSIVHLDGTIVGYPMSGSPKVSVRGDSTFLTFSYSFGDGSIQTNISFFLNEGLVQFSPSNSIFCTNAYSFEKESYSFNTWNWVDSYSTKNECCLKGNISCDSLSFAPGALSGYFNGDIIKELDTLDIEMSVDFSVLILEHGEC